MIGDYLNQELRCPICRVAGPYSEFKEKGFGKFRCPHCKTKLRSLPQLWLKICIYLPMLIWGTILLNPNLPGWLHTYAPLFALLPSMGLYFSLGEKFVQEFIPVGEKFQMSLGMFVKLTLYLGLLLGWALLKSSWMYGLILVSLGISGLFLKLKLPFVRPRREDRGS